MSVGAIGASSGYQVALRPMRPPSGEGDGAERFSLMDTDGDGGLSLTESGMDEEMFAQLDTDGDGLVTQAELEAGKPEGGPPAGAMGPPPDPSQLIEDLDSDGDGAVSQAESGWDEEMFSEVDSDGDGKLTLEELQAHEAQRQQAMMEMMQTETQSDTQTEAASYLGGYGMAAYQTQSDMSLLSLLMEQSAGSVGSLDLTA